MNGKKRRPGSNPDGSIVEAAASPWARIVMLPDVAEIKVILAEKKPSGEKAPPRERRARR